MGRNGLGTISSVPILLIISIGVSSSLTRVFEREPSSNTFMSLFWKLFLALYILKFFWDSIVYPTYYSPLRHIPGPKGWSSADGLLFENPRGLACLRWIKSIPNDGLIRSRSFDGSQFLLITSARIFADVLVNRSYEFEKPQIVRRFLARIVGWGLIAAEGSQHRLQRKTLTQAFHAKNIRGLYPLMWDKSMLFTDMLAKEVTRASNRLENHEAQVGELDICEWTSRLTLDIIGPAAMGKDFQTLTNENDTVARNYLEVFHPSVRRMLYFILSISTPPWFAEWWPSSTNASIKRTVKVIRGVCLNVVREKKQEISEVKTEDVSSDILSSMLKEKEISENACVDQMLTFLAAGHETTASALSWACFLLCKHPEVQMALRAEIRERLNPAEPISASLIDNLPLLCGVCNEVLRLYPTVPITAREVMADTNIGGFEIPKETWLVLCPWATNRDPGLWGEDAEEFRPDRWIDTDKEGLRRPNNSGSAANNYAMLTFLHGPRSCIGQSFARAELRCAVAALVGRFAMELQRPDEEVISVGAVTTKPKNGINLRLKLLSRWAQEGA